MKIETKHWYWIAGIAGAITVTGGLLYYYNKKKKKKEEEKEKKKEEIYKQKEIKQEEEKEEEISFPLKRGIKNSEEVKVLQKYMNSTCRASLDKAKVYPLKVDGNWEDKTEMGAISCTSVKRNEVDQDFYVRIYKDMEAAEILP